MVRLIALLPFVAAVMAEVGTPKAESIESMMDYSYDLAEGNAQLNQPAQVQAPEEAARDVVPTEFANPELASTIQPAPAPVQPIQPTYTFQQGANPVEVISAAQAQAIVTTAMQKAVEIKSPSNIAVVDPYGHLVAFVRMDGAPLVSIDVSLKKAKTVSMFGGRFRTGDLMNATSPGGPLYGIERTNNGLIFFGGGVPLKLGGQFIAAIGVSGGTAAEDVQIANAAAATLK